MFLTAPLIHNGYEFLPEGSVLEVNDDGVIVAILDGLENDEVITHQGVLCPGFVNVHCHLELSHLRDMMPQHTGLIPFLQKIPSYRIEFTNEQIKAARHEAYLTIIKNGIVAVGDIANTTDSLDLRAHDQLHYHTFVECIGFTEQHAKQRFDESVNVYNSFAKQEESEKMLRQSIVPHASYSVSKTIFDLIDRHRPHAIISIHNQESRDEDEYYKQKTGGVKELLNGFGIKDDFFNASGKSSLQTYAEWLSPHHSMIFVHNTYTTKEDVEIAVNRFSETSWCLCPNANLYIENKLPDVTMFAAAGVNICIGTDSLASNHRLCILSELVTIKNNFPQLSLEQLLHWATINGAKALKMQEEIGSFEVGKKPGIVHIANFQDNHPGIQRVA